MHNLPAMSVPVESARDIIFRGLILRLFLKRALIVSCFTPLAVSLPIMKCIFRKPDFKYYVDYFLKR